MENKEPILVVKDLKQHFKINRNFTVKAAPKSSSNGNLAKKKQITDPGTFSRYSNAAFWRGIQADGPSLPGHLAHTALSQSLRL